VGVEFHRSPASAGLTSARPRITASTFPCVERWTRRAAFGGWPSPNRTLPTSGRLLSPHEHQLTGSSRLPAILAWSGPPPRTPVRASARTARGAFHRRRDPRASSFPDARDRSFAPPWIVWRKAPRTRSPAAHPRRPRQRCDGRPPARPTPPVKPEVVNRRCVRLDFCFPLPSIEHPRLVRSRSLRIRGPGLSRDQTRFGGTTCVFAGRCLPGARLSSEPLTPLAASVAARLGRRRPAARES